jgi:hypothetical protein
LEEKQNIMCQQHHDKYNSTTVSPKLKFYRNLRAFLVFNLIFAVLSILGSGFEFWKASAIWSIFLVIKYVKLFGLPGTNGWFSDDWDDWMAEREAQDGPAEAERPANWREKDLV